MRDIVGNVRKSAIETLINEIGVSCAVLRVDRAKNEIEWTRRVIGEA